MDKYYYAMLTTIDYSAFAGHYLKFLHVAAVTPILPIILFCQFQITNIPVSFNHEAGHEDPTSRLLRLQCASLCFLAVFNYDIDLKTLIS